MGNTARHWSPFPQRILTATCLVWKTCLSRYCFCCVQWSGWFFYHTYQNNTSAPFRSASGDVIAIPRGLLVLTVSPVGRMHILKCLALYFNAPVGLPGKGRGQEGLRLFLRDPAKSQLLCRDALPLLWELLCPEELSHGSPVSFHHPNICFSELCAKGYFSLHSQSMGGRKKQIEQWEMV